jgi:undecaprenyl-diphosphatase
MDIQNNVLQNAVRVRIDRLTQRELNWCLLVNRSTAQVPVERLFAIVSRLGDGVFWYVLMACMIAFYGQEAMPVVLRMLIASAAGLLLYKWLKTKTIRPRPCHRHRQIRVSVAPLDEFSFPSGHTLHAMSFTAIAVSFYPALGWLLVPFALLVALSRLVLGLHYPSDVMAGALLGLGLAVLVVQF